MLDHWLNNMEINSLKAFDATLVLFLLNGISDDNTEISKKCLGMLEDHGKAMREALVELGDEEGDAVMKTKEEEKEGEVGMMELN